MFSDFKEKFQTKLFDIRSTFAMQKEGVKEKTFIKCIYCGSKEKLSDEHALAYGFNGNHILRNASCENCREITSKFETKILRGLLADYRSFKKFRSRSKHKTLQVNRDYRIKDFNHNESTRNLSLSIAGSLLFIPEFETPSLEKKNESMHIKNLHYIRISTNNKVADIDEILFTQEFPLEDYLCFLAKTAYCFACLDQNIDEFELFILPIILNKNQKQDWHYIGSPKEHIFKKDSAGTMIFITKGIISCHMKLFKESPVVYEVIIGKKSQRKF